ncbi:B12-binding domain-containing radical SAM protein [Spirochaeta cellobiosiphila]|uniref:B12-binding domain-containing radical SAM protein n=1 Tax=Spirochaeta cellobiosiphila TaxID=504483 RepID=UPI00041BC9BF|nr:B12-binding domain-containing radical SAM protein [Spirochaeta cellobiosiphila]
MRLLFINQHTGSRTFPLASASLASTIEQELPEVLLDIEEIGPDFGLEDYPSLFAQAIPDVICLTIYIWSVPGLSQLGEWIKAQYPQVLILAGGPEITADPIGYAQKSYIDLALPGEGEAIIAQVIKDLDNSDDKAQVLSKYAEHKGSYLVENLDTLPSPFTLSALSEHPYEDMVWELTRGCPFKCHFCFESKGNGKLRGKSLDKIREELRQLQERNTRELFILDPTFNYKPQRAKDILKLFIEEAPDIHYNIEVRSEFLDEEQAWLFSQFNCSLQIGLQSANPSITKNIGRPFDPDQYQNQLSLLNEAGVVYGIDLIYGLPGDTLEGFWNSVEFVLDCKPNHIDVFPLMVLPGTTLSDTASKLGLRYLQEAPYLILDRDGFDKEDLTKAESIMHNVNQLYNQGKAVMWLDFILDEFDLGYRDVFFDYSLIPDGRPLQEIFHLLDYLGERAQRQEILPIIKDMVNVLYHLDEEDQSLLEGCTYNPQILWEQMEQGIGDPEELMFFVPLK